MSENIISGSDTPKNTRMQKRQDAEKNEKQLRAAEEILNRLIRNITAEYPMFGIISECFELVPVREEILFETDTKNIYYSPIIVLRYVVKKKMDELKYGYMHILCHGLLNHFTIGEDYSRSPIMHRLMDMEVFLMLDGLKVRRKNVRTLFKMVNEINLMRKGSSLMKNYRNILRTSEGKQELMKMLMQSAVFTVVDHHDTWMNGRRFWLLKVPQESEYDKNQLKDLRKFFFGDSDSLAEKVRILAENAPASRKSAADREKNVPGKGSNDDEKEFNADRKPQLEYTEVLRRFLKVREVNHENPESMDKAMYALGLQMYGNIPLIEPEEEAEYKCLGTIVVAIDTSGSCWGEPLEQFLAETKAMFQSLGNIRFDRFVILQCDEKIRREDSYRSAREFPNLNKESIKCFGNGGTSFVPVFDRISEMQEKGERVECLIYLSDAMGEFPENRPENYETFFVIPKMTYEDEEFEDDEEEESYEEDSYLDQIIPQWIHRLELNLV